MPRSHLGLDIDFSGLKVAETVYRGRQKIVTKVAEQALPAGVVVDGRIMQSQLLAKELKSFLSKQDFQADSATLGLRSAWITVKTHRFPIMRPRELDKALEFEIPELVTFPILSLKDVAYDYFVNNRTDHEIEVVVVACPRQHLQPYIELMHEVGLTLEGIDVPAFGWQELLPDGNNRCFIEVSQEQTTIQINLNGFFKVLRVVPVGALHFRKSIGDAFSVSAEEAQQLMHSKDLDYLLMKGEGSERALRATTQRFLGSILQTLDFVRAELRASSFRSMLEEIVFLGDLADVAGVAMMLQEEIDLTVRTLADVSDLQIGFSFDRPERLNSYGSAITLGLRGLDS